MRTYKKYLAIVLIVIPVIVLVIIRSVGTGHFRYDAERWAEPSLNGSNIISPGKPGLPEGNVLAVALDGKAALPSNVTRILSVPADSILSKKYSKQISRNDGPMLLCSSELSVSARTWMILSQSGFKNVYIFTGDSDNEVLKEKFRPDTIAGPEPIN